MSNKIILQTDGGARGNPGPAGAGVVILDERGEVLKTAGKFLGDALTNNEAEYQALIFGLDTLKKYFGRGKMHSSEVEVRMDSELLVKQLNGEYQIKEKNLGLLFLKVWNSRVADFPHLTFTHIPREENSLADKLANEAMDSHVGSPPLFS